MALVSTYAVSNGGCIKIGKAGNVGARICDLQTASPYELVPICIFDGDIEAQTLRRLRATFRRMRGEWFEDSTELRAALYEMGFVSIDAEVEQHLSFISGAASGFALGVKHATGASSVEEHW